MPDNNPLLQRYELPPFSVIRAEHLVPAVQTIIAESRVLTTGIIANQKPFPTWDDLVLAMDELEAHLDGTLNIIYLLGSANRASAWQEAITLSYVLAEQYKGELAQNSELYQLYRRLADSPIAALFNEDRKRTLHKVLHKYHLAGLDLPSEQQLQLKKLNMELSGLQREFLDRVEGSNRAWSKHIEDRSVLSGLPSSFLVSMEAAAQAAGLSGWLLTLSSQSLRDVMTYADNRMLRQQMMVAYYSRASDTDSDALTTDNERVLAALLDDRHKKAQLLGYPNFAQLAVADQMADTTEEVVAFLHHQIEQSRSAFTRDSEQLKHYATLHGITDVKPWDIDYFAEKIRQDTAGISQEEFRKYFPLETVLQRFCVFTKTLFGVDLIEQATTDTWHADVRSFELREYGEVIGYLFIDPFRREGASGLGAALGFRNRRITAEGRPRRPIAVLTSQLPPPAEAQPCLLDHLQLRVLLHEFAHCLQHLLTAAPYRAISGIGQLSHDTSEFVSQVFEQFCFTQSFLIWLSGHVQTGQPLPENIANRVNRFAHTQTSWGTAAVLLTGLVDFELHRTYGDGRTPHEVFTQVNAKVGLLQWPDGVYPVNSFEPLVGGDGAKTYSYKWSGVLATQAFERFEREGLFNPTTAKAFRDAFMTPGDTRPLMKSLQQFLGRTLSTPLNPRADGEVIHKVKTTL